MSITYNRGRSLDLDWVNDDIRCLLVDSGHAEDVDDDYVADIVANELSGTGYARFALTGKSVNIDDTGDLAEFIAADYTFSAIDAGTPAYAIIYRYGTGDSDSPLIASLTMPGTPTNGGPYTIDWNSDAAASGKVYDKANAP